MQLVVFFKTSYLEVLSTFVFSTTSTSSPVDVVLLYCKDHYLALINRAGGLYGRILTEVVSTDRTQGLYTRPRSRFSHTDRLSSVNKMFIIRQEGNFNSFNVTGLLTFCLRTAMSLTETCLFVIRLFGTSINDRDENKRKW